MGLAIIEPIVPAALAVSRGSGGANLLTDDPREVWLDSAASGDCNIDIDLGADRSWDTVALINSNGRTDGNVAVWAIHTGTAAQAAYSSVTVLSGSTLRAPAEDLAEVAGPAAFVRPVPIVSRYIRILVSQGSPGPAHSIGRVVIGRSWQPEIAAQLGRGHEFGAGRPPLDTGSRTRLEAGGIARTQGSLVSGFQWVFGDLSPVDLKALWGMMKRLRTTMPAVLIEDTANIVDAGIHYGMLNDLERFERNDADKSRWALKFEDWM